MKAFKLFLSLAAIATLAQIAPSVFAQAITKDSTGRIYVRGNTASQPASFSFSGSPQTRRVLANQCGVIVIPALNGGLPSSVQVSGSVINPSSLPTGTIPRCVNGSLEVPVSGDFTTPTFQTVVVNKTPNLAVDAIITGTRERSYTADACGTIRITSSASFNPGDSFSVGGGSATSVSAIPTTNPPLCRTGILYLPSDITP